MDTESRTNIMNRAWEGVEETYHGVSERASHVKEAADHYTQEAPLAASLVSFGIGVGLGLFLTHLLVPQQQQRRSHHWYDSYLGEDRAQNMEHMMQRYLPEQVRRRMGM
jgi:hypothetical protein